MTRSELRSTLVVLALVAVAIIALWPRGRADQDGGGSPDAVAAAASAASGDGGTGVSPGSSDPTALAAARAGAALAPCPASTTPAPSTPAPGTPPAVGARPRSGPLDGLVLDCLGRPGAVDLAPALAGRTTLLNLWASWCGPCREEIPALSAYAAEPGAADVLGVAVADSPVPALGLLQALGARYPSVTDPDRVLAGRAGAPPVLPASVLVRPDGSVAAIAPQVFRSPDAVRTAVAAAVAAPGPSTGAR